MAESFAEKVKRINDKHFVNPKRLPKWMANSASIIFLGGLLFLAIVIYFVVMILRNSSDWTSLLALLPMLYFSLIGFSALYAGYRVKKSV